VHNTLRRTPRQGSGLCAWLYFPNRPRQAANLAGTHLAWGNADGTVTVCNLREINRRLMEVGLDWQE
jgi:hypothetical protein